MADLINLSDAKERRALPFPVLALGCDTRRGIGYGTDAFILLAVIRRNCVDAVQLLFKGQQPPSTGIITAAALIHRHKVGQQDIRAEAPVTDELDVARKRHRPRLRRRPRPRRTRRGNLADF